jgi:hypothetical protein
VIEQFENLRTNVIVFKVENNGSRIRMKEFTKKMRSTIGGPLVK